VVKELEKLVREFLGKKLSVCDSYTSSLELSEVIGKGMEYQLYLLDVQMPDKDGIELGETIRENDQKALIVFISSHSEYMANAFDVITFNFIIKPVQRERVKEVLLRAGDFFESKNRKFLYKTGKARIWFHMKKSYILKAGREK
jgi:two-component SAPR family response regulator